MGDEGPESGMALLERELPRLRNELRPDFVVVNAENASLTGPSPVGGCGVTPQTVERLWALEVDLITGGNHSWDGPHAEAIHASPFVLRPANYGRNAPGVGSALLPGDAGTLGVVNLVSKTALPNADHPLDQLEAQLETWGDAPDAVLVDFHGESVSEKQIFAWAVAGRVAAVLGTHTHVATLDTRILPGGTAYVSDVGMTGPEGGMQGYDPEPFIDVIRTRLPHYRHGGFARGPAVLGAVTVDVTKGRATAIERLDVQKGVVA